MLKVYYTNIERMCSTEQWERYYAMLPPERRERVDCAGNERIAHKRLLSGVFLQEVISRETGIPIPELRYKYNEWGKPELDEACGSELRYKHNALGRPELDENCVPEGTVPAGIHFNLSHSGEYAVLAIGDAPVGVDIEHRRRNYPALAKRFFCIEEYEDIMSAETEVERQNRFLEYWTMKEAYVKCVGEGLRIPLNSFRIQREREGVFSTKEHNVTFYTRFIEKNYCIAICSEKNEENALRNILVFPNCESTTSCVLTRAD